MNVGVYFTSFFLCDFPFCPCILLLSILQNSNGDLDVMLVCLSEGLDMNKIFVLVCVDDNDNDENDDGGGGGGTNSLYPSSFVDIVYAVIALIFVESMVIKFGPSLHVLSNDMLPRSRP